MSEPPHRTGQWKRRLAAGGPAPTKLIFKPRFEDLDTSQPIKDVDMLEFAEKIKLVFKKGLYLWQAHAIQKLRAGHDVMIKAGTGSGKSLPVQAMALSRPDAVVLVVSPLLALMDNQVETLLPQVDDIPAVALTARAIAEDPTLWDRVANGEYRIVYATEQTILDKSGPFSKQIIKKPGCAFMKNLCLIAVDECHVIHEWQGFRPQYAYLGSLRLTFSRVPWAVMSATLTPNASAYIHEVLCLKRGTFRISLPLHRDNINIEVAATDGKSLQPLYDLIPEQLSDLNELQKTIIFTDTVDPSIDIAALLAQHLPERFGRMRNTAVAAYYGDLGAETKAKVLKDFTTGRTRIVVCTDAFGLGVDIPDITRCVQWQVTDKLNVARLCQRIGRCVRAKDLEGVAIVYASREILADVPKGQWEEAWAEENNVVNVLQGYEDDDLAVPISKNRKFNLYGIPVTRETEGLCKQFTSQLYAKVDSLSKAIQQAASELVGTPTNKVSMSMKLDPPLLWFLTTEGCRHRVFGMIFRDPVLWTAKHRYWCCDNCAIASGRKLEEISTHGISPVLSYSNPSPPPKKRRNAPSKRTGPSRPTPVTADHIRLLEARLKVTREAFWESANVPDTFPELWLPNKPLAWIAKHAKRITNVEQLTQELESQGFRPKRSFLSPEHLNHIVWVLDVTLSSDARDPGGEQPRTENPPAPLPEDSRGPEDQENIAPAGHVPIPPPPPPNRPVKHPFTVLSMIQQTNEGRDGHTKRMIHASSRALDNVAAAGVVRGVPDSH